MSIYFVQFNCEAYSLNRTADRQSENFRCGSTQKPKNSHNSHRRILIVNNNYSSSTFSRDNLFEYNHYKFSRIFL